MAAKTNWQAHDPEAPLGQGDLVLVAWAKTIAPEQLRVPVDRYPIVGARDALDLPWWDERARPATLGMGGRTNYSLAVVVTEGCAIDKEYNVLRAKYLAEGCPDPAATERALAAEEGYLSVAEAWPVEALPEHLRQDAASGALGYVPFTLDGLFSEDQRQYAVDLSRVATVSFQSVHRRLGSADDKWVLRLQSAICRFYAARTIRVGEDLAVLFRQAVARVEALTAPTGNPPRVRARLHFTDGRKVDMEAILTELPVAEREADRRPGFRGRG